MEHFRNHDPVWELWFKVWLPMLNTCSFHSLKLLLLFFIKCILNLEHIFASLQFTGDICRKLVDIGQELGKSNQVWLHLWNLMLALIIIRFVHVNHSERIQFLKIFNVQYLRTRENIWWIRWFKNSINRHSKKCNPSNWHSSDTLGICRLLGCSWLN